jgi:uncharacterized protein YegL
MEPSRVTLAPVYLVVDVSWSMSMAGKLDAANRMIGTIADALARHRAVARQARIGVIDFSDDAQVRLPLCDLVADDVRLPRLSVRNGTSFSSAFTVLRWQIEADVTRLAIDNDLLPPTVFFMSDGGPTDDETAWRTAFEALISHRSRPAVVPCGMDEAEAHVMGSLIHPPSGPDRAALFMMARDCRAAAAIASVGDIVVSSLMRVGGTDGRVVLPIGADVPAGVLRYEPEDFA